MKQLSNGHRYLAGQVLAQMKLLEVYFIICILDEYKEFLFVQCVTLWNSVYIIPACIAMIYL